MEAPEDDLVLESASSLARKIRERKVTSERVIEAFIERINQVNGTINALVDDRFEEALVEARRIDDDIREGKGDFSNKPFLGKFRCVTKSIRPNDVIKDK